MGQLPTISITELKNYNKDDAGSMYYPVHIPSFSGPRKCRVFIFVLQTVTFKLFFFLSTHTFLEVKNKNYNKTITPG